MFERADTSEVIDLNTLALPLYSVNGAARPVALSRTRYCSGSKRTISLVSIATIRTNISLPDWIRSKKTNPLATEASRQAAHSIAEPRASSKNFALLQWLAFLFFREDFPGNSFASLNIRPRARRRARPRMAQLGLLRSRAPGIAQDRSARSVW